eukprot:Blabericola_migrator_1__7078@NODE_358_length_9448_cov_212_227694_g286_i0_p1_GENE_NODE_358_length_9448_cov_212_227694_g286_i0NODE_358_length_9448_cov_212_227694_g286_i0_p1_ORF_typecomplete_len2266_score432_97KAP/PF05804_12/16KAP/PF05804_12/5_1KAP/PF05804_12/1_7e08KAP/PF05804_12/4_8e02Arm_2/PF04826_13/4_8e03Arm_2/PF04826_13/1_1e03Arm_2/PF04826_13/5_7Arm_2/PF04826_13/0_095Arm_2/PF04826_13/3_2e06Arm_2/PF04826_13/2_1Arm_2/PF04826_13/4_9e03VATPase_H_N/PF03224_14/2_6e03VATPase_H_N/PF03224_14/1_1VATPase
MLALLLPLDSTSRSKHPSMNTSTDSRRLWDTFTISAKPSMTSSTPTSPSKQQPTSVDSFVLPKPYWKDDDTPYVCVHVCHVGAHPSRANVCTTLAYKRNTRNETNLLAHTTEREQSVCIYFALMRCVPLENSNKKQFRALNENPRISKVLISQDQMWQRGAYPNPTPGRDDLEPPALTSQVSPVIRGEAPVLLPSASKRSEPSFSHTNSSSNLLTNAPRPSREPLPGPLEIRKPFTRRGFGGHQPSVVNSPSSPNAYDSIKERRRQTVAEMRSLRREISPHQPSSSLTYRGSDFTRERSPTRIVPLLPSKDDRPRKDDISRKDQKSPKRADSASNRHTPDGSRHTDRHERENSRHERPEIIPTLPLSSHRQKRTTFQAEETSSRAGSRGDLLRTSSVESAAQSLSGHPVEPAPSILQRAQRAQNQPDKYRDGVVAELLNQLTRDVPVPHIQRRGSVTGLAPSVMTAAGETITPEIAAASVAVVMERLAVELDRPLKDHRAANREFRGGLKKAVEVAAVCPPRDVNAVRMLEAVGKVVKRRNRKAVDETAVDALDTGATELFAQKLRDRCIIHHSPEFAKEALQTLSAGLTCTATQEQVRQICKTYQVPDKANRIANDSTVPYETQQAAAEFGLLYSDASPTSHRPSSTQSTSATPTNLEVMMRVVARRVRDKPDQDNTETQMLPQKSISQLLEETGDQSKDDLEKLIKAFNIPANIQNPVLAAKFAELVNSYACRDRTDELAGAGAHEVLLAVLRAHPADMPIVGLCLDAFSRMADDSPDMAAFVAEHVTPAVQADLIKDDPDVVIQFVDLLEDLVVNGEDETIKLLPKNKILKDLEILESTADPLDVELLGDIADIRAALSDRRSVLTLKEVYSILLARQHADDSLNISEERTMKRLYQYIRKKVREYGVAHEITDGIFGFTGSEFMYGCMCFQILASVEDNHPQIVRSKIPQLLLESLAKQQDEQVAQHAVLTSVALASLNDKVAGEFVAHPAQRELIVSVLERGRKATEYDMYNEVEDLVGPRVQLIEKTAINRNIYKDTQALTQLIDTWDDYDYFWYSNIRVRNQEDLQRLFKLEKRQARKDFFREAMSKRSALRRHKETPVSSTNNLQSRLQLRRRSSVFGKRQQSHEAGEMSATHSPLERRKSVMINMSPTAGTPSPLEKRRSVRMDRRSSLGSEKSQPGLMRRASQFFTSPKNSPTPQPAQSVALARRASMANASPQRRGSLIGREKSMVAIALPDTAAPRASALQRRASLAPAHPDANMERVATKLQRHQSIFNDSRDGSVSDASYGSTHWDEEEAEGVFIPRMLEYVFKAMRRVCDAEHLPYLKKRNVPMRLVGVVADLDTPPAAFPDVLFLIGTLAPLEQMKDTFHGYKAVEKIIKLLKRAYKQQGAFVSEVVTNACLALATLCVVHLPNTKRFRKKKGAEIIVDTLNVRGSMNDHKSVNAASALICNLCFKNEKMKDLLGEEGACEAVVKAMAQYEGSGSEAGSKNIASLFKAIGNLSLNQANLERMLASEIESAFASFMGEVDEELDDSTVESCLRTLSNLVIEKDNMERFEKVVVPLLSLLRKEAHTTSEIHRWAFITIANLCRWPNNAKTFCRNDGLRTIMIRLPMLEKSAGLRAAVITALGIQTTFPENIERLTEAGIFEIISETLKEFLKMVDKEEVSQLDYIHGDNTQSQVTADQQNQLILQYSQLPISALRCCHRLLVSEEVARECIDSGVFELAQKVLVRSLFQGMLSYEALRVIFACMSLDSRPGSFPEKQQMMILARNDNKTKGESIIDIYVSDDDWGERELSCLEQGRDPCGDEGCVGYTGDPTQPSWWKKLPPQVHRPEGKRVWETLDMTDRMIDMTEMVRRILSNEKALRNVRLQRIALAWLAYVSCERVCLPSLYRRLDVPIDPKTHAPMEEEEDGLGADLEDVKNAKLDRRRSVWQRVKREKKEKEESRSGFGRERKIDLTSSVDIIRRTIENLWFDEDCLDLACILLNNLIFCAYGDEELSLLVADVALYKSMKKLLDAKSEQAKPYYIMTVKNYKRFIQTESKFGNPTSQFDDNDDVESVQAVTKKRGKSFRALIHKDSGANTKKRKAVTKDDIALMNRVALMEIPLELSQWHIDPFPDGVQSLPAEIKLKLRKGGRAEVYDSQGQRNLLLWKGSHDLVLFEWKVLPLGSKDEVDPQYPFNLAISRFSTIAPGINHPYFGLTADSLHESRCCVLKGPGTPACPTGVNLCIKFKDSSSRDSFLQALSNWREACAFGFI